YGQVVAARGRERAGGRPGVGERIEKFGGGQPPGLVGAPRHKHLAVSEQRSPVTRASACQLRPRRPLVVGRVVEQRGTQDSGSVRANTPRQKNTTVGEGSQGELASPRPEGTRAHPASRGRIE